MKFTNIDTNKSTSVSKISDLGTQLVDLKPNEDYSISVRAYSKSGAGPWSEAFISSTLPARRHVEVIWSNHNGVFMSDLFSERTVSVLPIGKLGVSSVCLRMLLFNILLSLFIKFAAIKRNILN